MREAQTCQDHIECDLHVISSIQVALEGALSSNTSAPFVVPILIAHRFFQMRCLVLLLMGRKSCPFVRIVTAVA